jgi:hypothetical protein
MSREPADRNVCATAALQSSAQVTQLSILDFLLT